MRILFTHVGGLPLFRFPSLPFLFLHPPRPLSSPVHQPLISPSPQPNQQPGIPAQKSCHCFAGVQLSRPPHYRSLDYCTNVLPTHNFATSDSIGNLVSESTYEIICPLVHCSCSDSGFGGDSSSRLRRGWWDLESVTCERGGGGRD